MYFTVTRTRKCTLQLTVLDDAINANFSKDKRVDTQSYKFAVLSKTYAPISIHIFQNYLFLKLVTKAKTYNQSSNITLAYFFTKPQDVTKEAFSSETNVITLVK